jgi:hypothetical protein
LQKYYTEIEVPSMINYFTPQSCKLLGDIFNFSLHLLLTALFIGLAKMRLSLRVQFSQLNSSLYRWCFVGGFKHSIPLLTKIVKIHFFFQWLDSPLGA